MSVRRICVVTGTRAEYGLLQPLMRLLKNDPTFVLQIAVTGTHLLPRFGETWRIIADDGFDIDARIAMELNDDSILATARAMAQILAGMAEAFERLSPDIVIVLGDRYEILAAAEAAMLCRIPIAHIHGGEASEGVIDESIRHALSKISHFHFTASDAYRRRVIQLGEAPERVFNVGALALDSLAAAPALSRMETTSELGIAAGRAYFLVTYHPVTLSDEDPAGPVMELTAALDKFPDHHVVVTGVNSDSGHTAVSRAFSNWSAQRKEGLTLVGTLGQRRYYNAMRWSDAVVGNSSSGLLEAPALHVPSVNVGPRQRGRVRAASVLDCEENRHAIASTIARVLEPQFRGAIADAPYPFGEPGAAARIVSILSRTSLDRVLMKHFHDLGASAAEAKH